MIPKGIMDRYEVIKPLHEKAASAVYLVKHRQIGDTRVLKVIQKDQPGATRILSEANLLAGLQSPAIPTIYDVSETTEYIYLVEEFIDGQSLQEFLLDRGQISIEKLLDIMISVCEILEILHYEGEEAVLYRDMKPEHIILQQDKVKLIDFDIAVRKSESETAEARGSIAFAAPEQLRGQRLDERCDVYGIGKVLEYASSYVTDNKGFKLKFIVSKATEPELKNRTKNVKELRQMLESLREKTRNEKNNQSKHLNKRIAIIGNASGAGCSHIGVNICTFLNKKGYDCYYKGIDEKHFVQLLYQNLKTRKLREGILYHNNFRGLMEYGPNVIKYTPPDGNYVYDMGFSNKKDLEADIILYVVSLKPWIDMNNYPEWIKDENVIVVSNFSTKLETLAFSKAISKRIYQFPQNSTVFKISKEERLFYTAILKGNGFENI